LPALFRRCHILHCRQGKACLQIRRLIRNELASALTSARRMLTASVMSMIFQCMKWMKRPGKLNLPITPSPCRRVGWRRLIPRILWISWLTSMILSATVLNFPRCCPEHDLDIMVKAFEIAGYDEETLKKKFGALYNAFQYGAPPHAGMAPGIER